MSARALVIVFAVSLLSLVGCSREKSAWRSAQAADSPESYEQFIEAHPESTLVANARERLAQLAEEKDWRNAAGVDSIDAYRQFLTLHPSGKWAREAQIRIDNFLSTAAGAGAGAGAASTPAVGAPGDAGAGAQLPDVAPAAAASGGFGVQLGAFSSAERANDEWKKLQAKASGTLDGLAPRVVVGEAAGKTIYRLQAAVRDEAHARAVCGGLKASNFGCVVVLPDGR